MGVTKFCGKGCFGLPADRSRLPRDEELPDAGADNGVDRPAWAGVRSQWQAPNHSGDRLNSEFPVRHPVTHVPCVRCNGPQIIVAPGWIKGGGWVCFGKGQSRLIYE